MHRSPIAYQRSIMYTTGSLWNYYRDEPNEFSANNYNENRITNSASLKYKTSITGKTGKSRKWRKY